MYRDVMFQKLYDTKIQQVPLFTILEQQPRYKDIITENWTAEDLDNFNEVYSSLLFRIDEMHYELKRFENMKERFEEVLKIKYGLNKDENK